MVCTKLLPITSLVILASLIPINAQEAQEEAPAALGILLQTLAKAEDEGQQLSLLRGVHGAMKGRRGVKAPEAWKAVEEKLSKSENAEIRELVQSLGGIFGSTGAFAGMRQALMDESADPAARTKALESLVAGKDQEAEPLLRQLVQKAGPLRRSAIRGLASFSAPENADLIVSVYDSLSSEEKRDALATLATRVEWAAKLVAMIDSGKLPRTDVPSALVVQIRGFNDEALTASLNKHFGMSGDGSAEKQKEIAEMKNWLTAEFVKAGDVNHGRALYGQTCAVCHKLFDAGGEIGPEITGANRTDIDYLLQNIVDPNALIGEDYQTATFELKDGRVLVGMRRGETDNTVTIKTLAEQVVVPKGDVKSVNVSSVSMMPEGLLSIYTKEQVRDLFAYLGSSRQVLPLVTPNNSGDFFSGSGLAGWKASSDEAWTAENGEIVGRTSEGKAVSIESQMLAGNFQLIGQVKVNGVAEIVLRGLRGEEGFRGCSLSLGGKTPANIWKYAGGKPEMLPAGDGRDWSQWVKFEIQATGKRVRVTIDAKVVFESEEIPGPERTQVALHLSGEKAELRLKDLKITALQTP